jgi:competence protein ComEA
MKNRIRTTASLIALILSLTVLAALPAAAGETGAVNVNTASPDQLALLPRVGPAVAQRIVDYREENGAFKAPEDLMLVRGIGDKTFELIRPYVKLSGETTLSEKVRSGRSTAATAPADAKGGTGSAAKGGSR